MNKESKMAFFDLMNVEMSIVDAEAYIEENIEVLKV